MIETKYWQKKVLLEEQCPLLHCLIDNEQHDQ